MDIREQKMVDPSLPGGSGVLIGNAGEPIKLTGVKLAGVSTEAARDGESLKIWTRLTLTSDTPLFHKIAENFDRVIARHASQVGSQISLRRAESVLLIVHPDQTAELWVDTAAVQIRALCKRSMKAGSIVFEQDIVDVIGMRFPCVDIKSTDRLLYFFRQDWRFGLFFDFTGDLSLEDVSTALGTLYRRLKYHHLYDLLSNQIVFDRLVQLGWFPFAEIIGREFKALAADCEAGFDLNEAEKPHFGRKEQILRTAIEAFMRQDSISALKIILTEIEGVLADAHRAATNRSAKLKGLLKFVVEAAENKAGATDTLLFPSAFAHYMNSYTFAEFDPML